MAKPFRIPHAGLRTGLACLLACIAFSGCTRAYYRQQADGEVYNLLGKGIRDPRWALNRLSIEPDPTARFADPDCPDHPPMPPDDPTSHQLMHCVDCKAGYPCWHSQGDKPFVENPNFKDYLPYDDKGFVVLNREGSVQMALVNSPVYQNNLEELYLSALEVSQQRFEFDMQFFLRNQTFFTNQGVVRGGGQSRSILTTDTQLGAERLFSTGGLLTANLANSFMWQFSGPDTESVNTLLSAAFIQPLLQNAGRDFFLEGLTLQERLLLANIRAMQRYRQGFYVQVVAGVQAPPGPQRGGSGFGGAAAGFFGVAGLATTGGGGGGQGGTGNAGAGAAQVGGYLGLLQDARQIANLRANVAGLRRSLDLLEALYEANRIDRLQVDQARQQLFNQQSTLLTSEAAYQTQLDAFKITMGMPPCLPIRIQDSLLDQFELLGPDMVALQNNAGAVLARLAGPANGTGKPGVTPTPLEGEQQLERDLDALREAAELLRVSQTLVPPGASPFQPLRERLRIYEGRLDELLIQGNDLRRTIQQLQSYPAAVESAKALQQDAQEEVPDVEASLELLRSRADDRIESLESLAKREEVTSGTVDPRAFDIQAFRKRLTDLPAEYAQIDRRLSAPLDRWDARRRQLESQRGALADLLARFSRLVAPLRAAVEPFKAELARPGMLMLPPEAQRFLDELNRLVDDPTRDVQRLAADTRAMRELLDAVFQEVNVLAQDANALGLVQARARLEATGLIPIDLEQCTAMRVARENRLDLMNARAGLVDAWRLIQVRADALKAGLDVVFDGQINTLGDNPFRFRSPTGQLRAGLRWDTPITRLTERNIYRQELIRFQRARRNFITFNDGIDRSLRNILRTLELNQVNFELRRAAVQLAIEQVELAALRLQEPPRPGVVTVGLSNTTARDLIDALSALLNAQNLYLGVFLNYEQLRMQLDLDMGTMLLDDRGMWIDPGEIRDADYGGCGKDDELGAPEDVPLPPEDPASAALAPQDISTLILLPSDEELDSNQQGPPPQLPQPATAASKRALPEPRRLDAAAIESAKAVQPAGPRWSSPLPGSGWKTARPVSGQ